MKKKWMLTALISVVIVLVGIFGLIKWNEYKTTEIFEDIETKVTQMSAEDITRIEIYNGQVIIFNKKNDMWIDEEFEKLDYEEEAINQMVEEIGAMMSFQTISNVQDRAVYGITENSKIITIYDTESNSQTFRVGSDVAGMDATYIWSDTDEVIYLVEQANLNDIFWNREDIITKEMEIPLGDKIQSLVITENENSIKLIRNPEIGTPEYETWILEEAFKNSHEANTLIVEEYLTVLESFARDKFVTTNTENQETYGLDNPSLVIQINDTYTIEFGNEEGDYTYFKCSEEPYIYKMLTEKVKPFKAIDTFNMIRKEIYIPKLEELHHITLQQGDKINQWLIDTSQTLEELQQIDENEIIDETLETITIEEGGSRVGDIALTKEQTEGLISGLGRISLYKPLFNPEVEEKQERAAEIIITYHLKDKSEHIIELIPYDPSFYILRINGHVEFSVEKKPVVTFFNEFERVLKEQQKEISK